MDKGTKLGGLKRKYKVTRWIYTQLYQQLNINISRLSTPVKDQYYQTRFFKSLLYDAYNKS